MVHPADEGLQTLRGIITDFAEFCRRKGAVSEADTRAKVIDRVLVDVCHWPEAAISREDHVERGYLDYLLTVNGRPYVAVEAKRQGIPFTSPTGTTSRALKLSGTLLTQAAVKEAVHQVRGYCDDAGIRYAVATNGYAWIIFRAIREDIPWREGTARIFPSLEYVAEHFTEFWNLLSFAAIGAGALDAEFGPPRRATRELHRVIANLFNPYMRLRPVSTDWGSAGRLGRARYPLPTWRNSSKRSFGEWDGRVVARYLTRIVFMTAHHHAEDYVPFMKEVDAPVLEKPFSAEDLNAGLPQVDDAAPR